MNTQRRGCTMTIAADRRRQDAQEQPSAGCPGAAARRRERVLAGLAFVILIVGWDATLRLDERVAPPRMRMSHAVEREIEPQAQEHAP